MVHEYESAGLNVQQARARLDAGLHLWDPKTAGELQAAGISPKIAFRPMKSQGKQTDLTIYRMVSSGQWTVEDALDLSRALTTTEGKLEEGLLSTLLWHAASMN